MPWECLVRMQQVHRVRLPPPGRGRTCPEPRDVRLQHTVGLGMSRHPTVLRRQVRPIVTLTRLAGGHWKDIPLYDRT